MNKVYSSAFKSAYNKAVEAIKKPNRITSIIIDAGKKITSNKSSIKEIKDDLRLTIRLLDKWYSGEYKSVNTKTIIYIIAAITYFINPLDIIPDIVPIFGFTDDATMLLYVLNKVGKEIDSFREWERSNTINNL